MDSFIDLFLKSSHNDSIFTFVPYGIRSICLVSVEGPSLKTNPSCALVLALRLNWILLNSPTASFEIVLFVSFNLITSLLRLELSDKIDAGSLSDNYALHMSFITSPAMISPTTDGTNAVLPGISRRSVHLCCAPGGQIQCVRQDMDISSMRRVGCSSEYTTFSFFTLRLRHSMRITFASGQTLVL